ncbi:hypothetical protein [Microbispora rosea]|uniref:hypothetical protein n=1 Tax=Microbispora rosea TaxID=58117 RepID=UPI0004C3B201|nr:hypothetical protein [Microbispora rosea]
MQPRDAGFRVAVLDALHKKIGAELARLRDEAKPVFAQAATKDGMQSVAVKLPDGTKVATVNISQGTDVIRWDEDALLAYAREYAPTEVETVVSPHALTRPDVVAYIRKFHPELMQPRVRPAWRTKAEGELTNEGELVDGNGEPHKVAELVKGAPDGSFRLDFTRATKTSPAGRDLIAAAWRAGELGDVLALEQAPAIDAGDDQ